METREIKGHHVALIFCAAFSVIIGVNLVLATQAIRTFPGLETKNSYVASQSFDRERSAQDELRWQIEATLAAGQLILYIEDPQGPVSPKAMTATLGRSTHVSADRELVLRMSRRGFSAEIGDLEPGKWLLRLRATSPDGTPFRRNIPLMVRP